MENEEEERRLRILKEIAILSSLYYRNRKKFQKNPNLSHVVHATLNVAQFLSVLANELFHHIHHAVNRSMRSKDPTVPNLPEERNPVFIAYPFCMIGSVAMCILWIRFRSFERILETTLVGCAIGVLLMILSAVLSMRHAEIYINLNEVSDEELLTHPIFIHNFIVCVTSIFAMMMYLIHFWILYECWLWEKKSRRAESANLQTQEDARRHPEPSTSRRTEAAKARGTLALDDLKNEVANMDEWNLENEPVTLYCCCVDFWRYIEERRTRTSEFELEVTHVK